MKRPDRVVRVFSVRSSAAGKFKYTMHVKDGNLFPSYMVYMARKCFRTFVAARLLGSRGIYWTKEASGWQ